MRRLRQILRQDSWVWSVLILCIGVFLMPIYYALRVS
jgi:hypothetical protein